MDFNMETFIKLFKITIHINCRIKFSIELPWNFLILEVKFCG